MAYANGQFPKDQLVYFEGMWFFPGTLRRWQAFRADVQAETEETLELTSAYRDRDEQVDAREEFGMGAAYPGTSSHGGIWTGSTTGRGGLPTWVDGLETGALDVGDYYNIPWETFERLASKHGFITNIVVPQELWHIVDLDPWGHNLPEEEDMPLSSEDVTRIANAVWSKGGIGDEVHQIHDRVHNGLTGDRIGQAVWATGGTGAELHAIYDSVRFGEEGVRTHGKLAGKIVSEIGAQQIARAQGGGDIDVQALADAIVDQVTEVQASELADAILTKTAERLKG